MTTHQTRATLATSLLNNGAPAALVSQLLGHFSPEALAHYASYNDRTMTYHLQQVWAAGPGMDKPGTILLRPGELTSANPQSAYDRIDLTVVPVEHGLCRYGPVVGGSRTQTRCRLPLCGGGTNRGVPRLHPEPVALLGASTHGPTRGTRRTRPP
nr:tyrosine-type recombinase/integrase [Mycobacteroides abscessus]